MNLMLPTLTLLIRPLIDLRRASHRIRWYSALVGSSSCISACIALTAPSRQLHCPDSQRRSVLTSRRRDVGTTSPRRRHLLHLLLQVDLGLDGPVGLLLGQSHPHLLLPLPPPHRIVILDPRDVHDHPFGQWRGQPGPGRGWRLDRGERPSFAAGQRRAKWRGSEPCEPLAL